MNTQDVITRVQRTFGDEAAVQVNNDDVMRWINDAQIEIIKHNDAALQTTDFVNLVAGQSTYTMPTDLIILRSLRYKFSDMLSFSNLRFKNMQDFDESVDGWDGTHHPNANPQWFTMYEGQAILFPTPDQSMTAGLKVLYNRKPGDVTTIADALSLPLVYHNTIFKYCLWQASQLDEDHEPAQLYKADFQADIDVLLNKESSDPTATYPTITTLGFDQ